MGDVLSLGLKTSEAMAETPKKLFEYAMLRCHRNFESLFLFLTCFLVSSTVWMGLDDTLELG
jgi:hypothetical protein